MPANYNCLLLDIDGTLLDFASAEESALRGTLTHFHLPVTEDMLTLFSSINTGLWAQLERGEIKFDKLNVSRFTKFLQAAGAKGDAARMNGEFLTRLSKEAPLLPGAKEFLEDVAEFATLAATTNGSYKVQLSRLEKSGLLPYFDDVFISEKMGYTKPSPRFFDLAIQKLAIANKQRILIVGDSLTADIKGGINAKLSTCWCNFIGSENTTSITPTHTVRSFTELKLIAIGEEELKNAATREKRHIL